MQSIAKQHLSGLDFLRGAAAWVVAISHFFVFKTVAGDLFESISVLGVEIFFVLSGYVLAPQILKCLSLPWGQLGIFLVRRWMRTVPPYAVALVVISVILGVLGTGDFFRYLTYTQNLVRQSNEADYFSVAWSLSVEEWFYIVFPLVLIGSLRMARASSTAAVITATVSFILFITVLRFVYGALDDWGPSVRRVVSFRIDAIAYGFLLYVLLEYKLRSLIERISALQAFLALLVTAIIAMGMIEMISRGGADWPKHLFPFAAALFGSACIILSLRAEPSLDRRPRLARLSVFSGQISYSVYLFHLIFLILLAPVADVLPVAVQLVIYIAGLIAFTAAFYKSFERPILLARPVFKTAVLEPAH